MSLSAAISLCPPACAKPGDSDNPGDADKPGIFKKYVTPLLKTIIRPVYLWFKDHRQHLAKWLAIGLAIGVVTCAASFGLCYLLTYLGISGASAAFGAMGARGVLGIISAIIFAPINAWIRRGNQTGFQEHLGEFGALFLANTVSTVLLLPVGGLPFLLKALSTFMWGAGIVLPTMARFFPGTLDSMHLSGKRWLVLAIGFQILRGVITICCFGVAKAAIFLFINIPTFLMLFVLYYIDKQSGSIVPGVCTSVGMTLASLVASFLL
jgi:hypothetical protein